MTPQQPTEHSPLVNPTVKMYLMTSRITFFLINSFISHDVLS